MCRGIDQMGQHNMKINMVLSTAMIGITDRSKRTIVAILASID
jgi:hypothetical protein